MTTMMRIPRLAILRRSEARKKTETRKVRVSSLESMCLTARRRFPPNADGDTGYFIRLDLGSLEGYAGAGSVTVGAALRVTSGPDNNFPTGIEMRDAVAEVVADPEDNSVQPADAMAGTSDMIATAVKAVTFEGADGGQGNIDLVNRGKLAAPDTQVKGCEHRSRGCVPRSEGGQWQGQIRYNKGIPR